MFSVCIRCGNILRLKELNKSMQRTISTSAYSLSFFDSIKQKFRKFSENIEEDHREEFTSWAEFNSRGYVRPEYMKCWVINQYNHHHKNLEQEIVSSPTARIHTSHGELTKLRQSVNRPYDILVKVHAASVNPIDIKMCQGYMSKMLNARRYPLASLASVTPIVGLWNKYENDEFPLVLGRDFSGTVIDHGMGVEGIKLGDEVFGTPKFYENGCFAEYMCTSIGGVAIKPSTLSHVEAAALPYAGTVVLQGLSSLIPTMRGKRALVLGGSGGTGTLAIQLLKAYGCHVAVTCSEKSFNLCTELGASDCFNYSSDTIMCELKSQSKYNIIYDTVGSANPKWAKQFLVHGGTYICLTSAMGRNVTDNGVVLGLSQTAVEYAKELGQSLGIKIIYPFFKQRQSALYEIGKLVNDGLLKPVIQDVLPFEHLKEAFDIVESGHAKGKIVLNISQLEEATEKPRVEKVIHL